MNKDKVGLVVIAVVIVAFVTINLNKRNVPSTISVDSNDQVSLGTPTDGSAKTVAPTTGRTVMGVMGIYGGASSGQTGQFAITELAGLRTRVRITLNSYTPNVSQPAYIHSKQCNVIEGVIWPLTNVKNGYSETVLNVYYNDVASAVSQYSVAVHKSTTEFATITSCGNIILNTR